MHHVLPWTPSALAPRVYWTHARGTLHLPVAKATRTHHFTTLRAAGLLEQRNAGSRRLNRLHREESDRPFPGLLALVLAEEDSAGGRNRRRRPTRRGERQREKGVRR